MLQAQTEKELNSFTSNESMYKRPYLALTKISKKWTIRIKNWQATRNWFSIMPEERLQKP